MKKIYLNLVIIGIAILIFSCGEDSPQVTYREDLGSDFHYPNFGSTRYERLYDANRLCDDGKCFMVEKVAGHKIATSDECDRPGCGKRWYNHDKN